MDSVRLLLKILNGVQSGVEVALPPGEFSLGSGDNDDIQIIDVTLKPSHLRLRLAPGKIEIFADAGSFSTAGGLGGEAGQKTWNEIEPLDVVSAGTTRFALGPTTAQWTTITKDDVRTPASDAKTPRGPASAAREGWRQLALPVGALLVLVVLAAALILPRGSHSMLLAQKGSEADLVREAVAAFPFVHNVTIRQDVDGTIYAQGYVESLVERRAVAEAIEKTGVQARVRIYVLQVLRSEIDSLVAAERVNVTFKLKPDGAATFEGVILLASAADRFMQRVRENAIGLSQITSHIRTGSAIVDDMNALLRNLDLRQQVFLRLDQEVVEANGVVPTNKVDAWIGFLQDYSKRFGKDISLRSYVQLVNEAGTPVGPAPGPPKEPVVFGADVKGLGPNAIGIDRLKSGEFAVSNLFAASKPAVAGPLIKHEEPVVAMDWTIATPPIRKSTALRLASASPAGPGNDEGDSSSKTQARIRAEGGGAASSRLGAASKEVETTMGSDGSNRPATRLEGTLQAASGAGSAGTVAAARGSTSDDLRAIGDRAGTGSTGTKGIEAGASAADGAKTVSPKPTVVSAPKGTPIEERPGPTPNAKAFRDAAQGADDELALRGSQLLRSWLLGAKPADAREQDLRDALDTVAKDALGKQKEEEGPPSSRTRDQFARAYLPLLAEAPRNDTDACRPSSRLTRSNVAAALFWLDILSSIRDVTIDMFGVKAQGQILEAALDPALAEKCLTQTTLGHSAVAASIYLAEAARNPDFVQFVTRTLPRFNLKVTGASVIGRRYVQLSNGDKMREGTEPDLQSRIDAIGQLGVAIAVPSGFSRVIFGRDINWLSSD